MAAERFAKKALYGLMLLGMVFTNLVAGVPAKAGPALQAPIFNELEDFALVADSTGWVLMDSRLYWTVDDGAHWQDITPSLPDSARLLSVTFTSPRTGWVLWSNPDSDGSLSLQISSTSDSGVNWSSDLIQSLPSTDLDAIIENASMDWLDETTGWVSLKRQTGSNFSAGALFHTIDGGRNWVRSALPAGEPVSFVNPQIGWLAGGPGKDQLFKTLDAGLTWTEQPLPTGLETGQVSTLYTPGFDPTGHGLLAAITLEADLFQLNVYSSVDSGKGWNPLATFSLNSLASRVPLALVKGQDFLAAIPGEDRLLQIVNGQKGSLTNQDGLSAGIVDLKMLSLESGWAKWNNSTCTREASTGSAGSTQINCTASTKLIETANGGITWKALLLPQVRSTTLFQNSSSAATSLTQVSAASGDNTRVFTGLGFDICTIPTLAQLDVWDDYSPYASVNLYIGGSARARFCDFSRLNASFVTQAYAMGWSFIPTWVGPQAPCTNFLSTISPNVSQAYTDGINEAIAAVNTLAALGLTRADLSGSIVYYDLETFAGDQACRDAVKSFMNGWDYQLKISGNKSGLYGSTGCTNGLNNYVSIDNKPDAIWGALWDDRATVWGMGCISDSSWNNHQRIHQYSGAHNEIYHGVQLNIDTDAIDSIVAIPNPVVVVPPPPSADFLASPTSGTGPLAVTFYIVSTANMTSCSWVYGDGQTGTSCALANTHVYANSGSYSVTLTVYGPGGQDDLTRSNYIVVSEPSKPDLVPYPLGSSAAPVIISSATGTNVNGTLYVNQPVYIDLGFKNFGNVDIATGFQVDLFIDDQRFLNFTQAGLGALTAGGTADSKITWNISGWHTVRLVIDAQNTVAESNENNNSWSGQFYWETTSTGGPTILAPTGIIYTAVPNFMWVPTANTQYYKLYLNSLVPGGIFFSYPSIPPSLCIDSICSLQSNTPLSAGDYQFRVGAMSSQNILSYSPWQVFSVSGAPPNSPGNLLPSGTIVDSTPTFSWTKSANATWYELYIYPESSSSSVVTNTTIEALSACAGTTCSWTPLTILGRGNYQFKIRAANLTAFSNYTTGSFYVNVDTKIIFLPFLIR